MYSAPVKGTAKNKTTLNWWEYWIGHCWMTGWQSIKMTFWIWRDLMTNNYQGYALLKEDDPEEECIDWFWVSLNEDDTYPKEYLEYLQQLINDIESGKEKVVPMDLDQLKEISDLLDVEDE